MSTELGVAYVQIIPSARGIKNELANQLDGPAKSAGQSAGRKSGDSFVSSMGPVLKGGLVAIAAAGATAAVAGFRDAIDREQSSANVAASFGLSPKESERTGRIAGDVYADAFGDSFGAVEGTVAQITRQIGTMSDEDLADLTANASTFADVFDTDVSEAVDRASILFKNGLAKDGGEALDLLTAGMQNLSSPSARDELLSAVEEYSTFFADMGFTGEEAFELIASSAEKGGKFGVDKVGDAVKEFSVRATDMSTKTVDAFGLAGLNAETMAAKFLAGGETANEALGETVEALLSMEDPVERSNAAIALFGTPLEDLSSGELPDFLDALTDTGTALDDFKGSADEMSETVGDTAATRFESFKRRALGGLSDFMTRNVLPALENFGDWWTNTMGPLIDDAVGWFRDELAPAFEPAVAAIRDDLMPVIRDDLIPALRDNLWPVVRDQVIPTLLDIGTVFVRDVLPPVITFVAFVTEKVIPIIQDLAKRFGDDLKKIKGYWDGFVRTIGGVWEDFKTFVNDVKTKANEILDWFKKLPQRVKTAVGNLLTTLKQKGRDLISGALTGIAERWVAVRSWFGGLPGRARGAIGNIASSLAGKGRSLISGLRGGIVDRFNSIKSWFQVLPGRVISAIGDLTGVLLQKGKDLIQGIIDGITSSPGAIRDAIVGLIPDSVHIPGTNINVRIPGLSEMHDGGIVPGRRGQDVPIMAQAGEAVLTRDHQSQLRSILSAASGGSAGGARGLTIEHATFGDTKVIPKLDFWARTKMGGI